MTASSPGRVCCAHRDSCVRNSAADCQRATGPACCSHAPTEGLSGEAKMMMSQAMRQALRASASGHTRSTAPVEWQRVPLRGASPTTGIDRILIECESNSDCMVIKRQFEINLSTVWHKNCRVSASRQTESLITVQCAMKC